MRLEIVKTLKTRREELDRILKQIEASKDAEDLTYEDYKPYFTAYEKLINELARGTHVGRKYVVKDGETVDPKDTVAVKTFNFDTKKAGIKMPVLKVTKITNADGTINENVGAKETRDVHAEQKSSVIAEMKEAQEFWENLPLSTRVHVIKRFADLVKENEEYFISALVLELGKTPDVAKGEIDKMTEYLSYATDDTILKKTFNPEVTREKGKSVFTVVWKELTAKLVGVIPAANYPIALMISQWVNSLICGSAVMHKPTANSMLGAFGLDELFQIAMVGIISDIKHTSVERINELNTNPNLVDLKDSDQVRRFAAKLSKVIIGREFGLHRASDHLTFVGGEDTWYKILQPERNQSAPSAASANAELGGIGYQLMMKSGFAGEIVDKKGKLVESASKAAAEVVKGAVSNNGLRCTAVKVALFEKELEPMADAVRDQVWDLQDPKLYGMATRSGVKFGPSFEYSPLVEGNAQWKEKAKIGALRELLLELGLKEKTTKDSEGHFFGGKSMNKLVDANLVSPFYADITDLIKDKKISEIDPRLMHYLQKSEVFGSVVLTAKGLDKKQIFELANSNELKLAMGIYASPKETAEAETKLGYGSCNKTPKDSTPFGTHGGKGRVGGGTHGHDIDENLMIARTSIKNGREELEATLDLWKEKLRIYFKNQITSIFRSNYVNPTRAEASADARSM